MLPVRAALWANVFALFYRAFGGDRRRRSPRRTVSKSVEGGRFFSFFPSLSPFAPVLLPRVLFVPRDFDRTPRASSRGMVAVFFFFTSPLCHHHRPSTTALSLSPPLSFHSLSLLYTPLISSLSFGSPRFFFPLFFHFSFFPFFSLFLSFFQNERLRACTGTERPARWASALIGDATMGTEPGVERWGPSFFERYFR